jgi:outer membrane receptor for ferric coprogen and ferric-rhodotorulic acid
MNTFQRPRSLTLRALASTTSKATLLNSMRLMALGAMIGAGLAGPAMAQARDYTIGPGQLSDVLARYAAASGVQL